jgi:hypothetical protein
MTAVPRTIRLEDLIGSRVVASDGRTVANVIDVRSECRDGEHQIVAYLLGSGALLERWSLTAALFGRRRKLVARWNQLDISDPRRPRLTCPIDEIEEAP